MIQTDLIIIGSGPGGYQAARYAAQQGLKVVIVENSHAGGGEGALQHPVRRHHAHVHAGHRHGADPVLRVPGDPEPGRPDGGGVQAGGAAAAG